jgi:hypothetical protein
MSWSIQRIRPGSVLQAPKLKEDKRASDKEIEGELKAFASAGSHLMPDSKLSKLKAKRLEEEREKERVMAYRAEKNAKDSSFQDRFEATLAKHDGKKVAADTTSPGTMDNYINTEISNLSNKELKRLEEEREKERVMAYLAEKNAKDSSFQDRFAAVLARHDGRKVPAAPMRFDPLDDNYDMEMITYEAMTDAGKLRVREIETNKARNEAIEIHEHLRAGSYIEVEKSERSEAAPQKEKFNKSKSRNCQEKEAQRVAEELKAELGYIDEDIAFSEKFEQILAKHDGKKQIEQGTDLGYYSMARGGMLSEQNNKRKHEADDEDELLASMQHMRVKTGRKR